MKISVVVLTKNEEKNIERCLKSLDFCDEIIIVDDFSQDKTLNEVYKVKKFIKFKSLKVFQRHLNGDFASQRNFGMEKARGEWVLFVDADEEISDKLQKEIIETVYHKFQIPNSKSEIQNSKQNTENEIKAYYIKRRDWWWGRELRFGEVRKIRKKGLLRLVKKDTGRWQGKVHEEFQIKNFQFKAGRLKNYLNHYPHSTLKEFLAEVNFYSTLRAKELFRAGKKISLWEIIFYPLAKFILNYFFYWGFLDGPSGFAYAFLMSFHSFLVRAKLYQYTRL